jgi:quercetin dioxygenase-like cupin family protein
MPPFDSKTVEIPAAGILSQTVHSDDHSKVVVFALDTGQELSEHRAASAATVVVTRGRLEFFLAGEEFPLDAGSFVHMPAGAPHALRAKEPTVMLLTLLRDDRG